MNHRKAHRHWIIIVQRITLTLALLLTESLGLLASPPTSTATQQTPTIAPIFHLHLGDTGTTFEDSSPNHNDGECNDSTYEQCPIRSTPSVYTQVYTNAVKFEGAYRHSPPAQTWQGYGDHIRIVNSINLQDKSFTVAFWAKCDASSADDDYIISHNAPIASGGLHIGFLADGTFQCRFGSSIVNSDIPYPDTEWHHWACTYDKDTQIVHIYRDGMMLKEATAIPSYQGTGTLYIGRKYETDSTGQDDFYTGLIDEVYVYTATLQTEQIAAHHHQMLLWHPLDETVGASQFEELSVFNNTSTCTYPTCPEAEATGKVGNALRFDGENDKINTSNAVYLKEQSFSFAFWAKRKTPGRFDYLIGQGGPNVPEATGLYIGFDNSNNFHFAHAGGDLSVGPYSDSSWHYWVCTYNANNNAQKIYRDGVLVSELYTATADYAGEGNIYFGVGSKTSGNAYFKGVTDDIRIFNYVMDTSDITGQGSGLSIHLPLDDAAGTEKFQDISGNGYHATCTSPDCPTAEADGQVETAAEFANPQSLLISGQPRFAQSDYTIALWFQSDPSTTDQALLGATDPTNNEHGILIELLANGQLSYLHRSPASSTPGSAEKITTTKKYDDGLWHHVATQKDGSTLRLYVDGKMVGTVSNNNNFSGGFDIAIGRAGKTKTDYFTGKLDDIRIYVSAISSGEILSLARLQQLWLTLDEAPGSKRFTDSSGNGNDGVCTTCPTAGLTGRLGRAIEFPDSNSDKYVTIDGQPAFAKDEYTIALWFQSTTDTNQTLFAATDPLENNHHGIALFLDSNGVLNYTHRAPPAASGDTTISTLQGGYNDGEWHLAVARRNSTKLELYIDGLKMDEAAAPAPLDNPLDIVLGRWSKISSTDNRYYAGLLDDVRIYGMALDESEILIRDAGIYVTTERDDIKEDGECSLREALLAATSGSQVDTCEIGGGDNTVYLQYRGHYTVTAHEFNDIAAYNYGPTVFPVIENSVTIEGRGATIRRAADALNFRFFHVASSGALVLKDMTIENGFSSGGDGGNGNGGGGGGVGFGGAIINEGILEIVNSTFYKNKTKGGDGGVSIDAGAAGGGGGGLGGDGGAAGTGGGGGAGIGGEGGEGGVGQNGNGGVGKAIGGGGGGASWGTAPGGEGDGRGGKGGDGGGQSGRDGGDEGGGGGGGGKHNGQAGNGGDGGDGGGGGGGGAGTVDGGKGGDGGDGGFGAGGGGGGTGQEEPGAGGKGGFGAGGGGGGRQGSGSGPAGTGGYGGAEGNGLNGGGGAGMGGAIFNHGGILIIKNSSFTANETLSGNIGKSNPGNALGGAIFNRNGVLEISSSTIVSNTAENGGGGIYNLSDGAAATFIMSNTIVANTPDQRSDCESLDVDGGVTIMGPTSTGNLVEAAGSNCPGIVVSGINFDISPLAANGGFAPTHALDKSNAAYNAGVCATKTDQRGKTRPTTHCDIGSFEIVEKIWKDPVDGDWSDDHRWDPAGEPTANDDVLLNNKDEVVITVDKEAEVGTMVISSDKVTVQQEKSMDIGQLDMSAGNFLGLSLPTIDLNIRKTLRLSGGKLKTPGGKTTISGTVVAPPQNNTPMAVSETGGELDGSSGPVILSGTLDLKGGEFKTTSDNLIITKDLIMTAGTFEGQGQTEIKGVVKVAGGELKATSTATDSKLTVKGPVTQTGGTLIGGEGETELEKGLLLSDGILTATTASDAKFTIDIQIQQSGGELTGGDGEMCISGTTIISDGTFTAPQTAITMTDEVIIANTNTGIGTLDGSKSQQLLIDDDLLLKGGTFIAAKTPMTITGNVKQDNGTFNGNDGEEVEVQGTITITDGSFRAPTGTLILTGNLVQISNIFNPKDGVVAFVGSGEQKIIAPEIELNDVIVSSGVTVATSALVTVQGILTNSGTTQENPPLPTSGALEYGLANIILTYPTGNRLTAMKVTRVDESPPDSNFNTSTGIFWQLEPTGTWSDPDLTLPYAQVNVNSKVCGYDTNIPTNWDCQSDSFGNGTVTRQNIPNQQIWVVGRDARYAHGMYLPLIMRTPVNIQGPDLIVQNLIINSNNIQVVIQNQGTITISDWFWVDVYINPNPVPAAVNQTWRHVATQGAVWQVSGSGLNDLVPGGTRTLNTDNSDPYYIEYYSDITWPLPSGTVIYAQVDSENISTNYGQIQESHELNGGPYNNIFGPIVVP